MPVKTIKRGKACWLGKVQVNNVIKTKVCRTKKEAKDWEDMMRANPGWAYPREETTIVTALSWANQYLDAMKDRRIADSTLDEKKSAFSTLFAAGSPVKPETKAEEITVKMADTCLRARMKAGSGYAANKARKNLSAGWTWGTKYLGLPKENPFSEVDKFPEVRKPRYVPPAKDFWAVYRAAFTHQDKLMLLGFLHTAARKRELLSLKWKDVDLEGKRIRLFTKKRLGGTLEADWIPMTSRLAQMFQRHAEAGVTSEFVFLWPEYGVPFKHRLHWLRKLCERAGVPPFDIHSIRHLSATMQAHGGLSLTAVQGMLRHRSATTTNRYLHQLTGVQVALDKVFREEDIPA